MAAPESLPLLLLKLEEHDNYPCGAGYRAIRSPRTTDRSSSFPSQLSRLQQPAAALVEASNGAHSMKQLGNDSCALDSSNSSGPNESSTAAASDDLAKRAHRRVMDHRRVEVERKIEAEKLRLKKSEQEKLAKEQANQAKQRRRAEIYALNASLRQLQQEKIAAFIASQQDALLADSASVARVDGCRPQAIGV